MILMKNANSAFMRWRILICMAGNGQSEQKAGKGYLSFSYTGSRQYGKGQQKGYVANIKAGKGSVTGVTMEKRKEERLPMRLLWKRKVWLQPKKLSWPRQVWELHARAEGPRSRTRSWSTLSWRRSWRRTNQFNGSLGGSLGTSAFVWYVQFGLQYLHQSYAWITKGEESMRGIQNDSVSQVCFEKYPRAAVRGFWGCGHSGLGSMPKTVAAKKTPKFIKPKQDKSWKHQNRSLSEDVASANQTMRQGTEAYA